MNYERIIAGIFVGAGSLMLIYQGYITEAGILLGSMVGFFVGEKNGARNAVKKP
jgi:uncharacterized membrane protein required for colicin V production